MLVPSSGVVLNAAALEVEQRSFECTRVTLLTICWRGWNESATPAEQGEDHSPKSSRSRLVWARLTGISVCFLSSIRSW